MDISSFAVEPIWQLAFRDKKRPELYSGDTPDEEGFLPLSDAQDFLPELATLTNDQCHAVGANNQLALKLAQDEYVSIQNILNDLQGRGNAKDPQALPSRDVFEEVKESRLYSYKYEKQKPALLNVDGERVKKETVTDQEKTDVRLHQEPFEQGGFVPSERQYKSILAKATDPLNPDGWKPVERSGRLLIPRQQTHHEEYVYTRPDRLLNSIEGEEGRPGTADSFNSLITPSKPANKTLFRTRFGGHKVPPTRDVSEAPSATSTPRGRRTHTPRPKHQTRPSVLPDGSPLPKRRKVDPTEISRQSNGLAQDMLYPYNGNAQFHPTPSSTTADHISEKLASTKSYPTIADQNNYRDYVSTMRQRKWTNDELLAAIRREHSWLHPGDPKEAFRKKIGVENSQNPVRTLSMYLKWQFWDVNGMNKRPRNRKAAHDHGGLKSRPEKDAPTSTTQLALPREKDPGAGVNGDWKTENQPTTPLPVNSPSKTLSGEGKISRSDRTTEVQEDKIGGNLEPAVTEDINSDIETSTEPLAIVKKLEPMDRENLELMTDSVAFGRDIQAKRRLRRPDSVSSSVRRSVRTSTRVL